MLEVEYSTYLFLLLEMAYSWGLMPYSFIASLAEPSTVYAIGAQWILKIPCFVDS